MYKIKIKSIKNRLFLAYFLTSTFLLIILCLFLYFQIKNTILESFDKLLHSKMQMVVANLLEERGTIDFEIAEAKLSEYTIKNSGHYYKVIIDKKILTSPSLNNDNYEFKILERFYIDEETKEVFFNSKDLINQDVRIIKKILNIKNKEVTVYLGESLKDTNYLIKKLTNIFYIVIPLGIFIIEFLGLKIAEKGLEPLEELSNKIKKINHENLNESLFLDERSEELDNIVNSFNSMLKRVDNAFETEKYILSEASHYLKTPITAIKANCDVTLKKERGITEYIETIKKIKVISNKMNKLVNDMLSQAKLDSEGLNTTSFEKISINECIKNALNFSESIALEKNITIDYIFDNEFKTSYGVSNSKEEWSGGSAPVPPETPEQSSEVFSNKSKDNYYIKGSEERITELFLNILENSIKYNKNNGSIKISLNKINNEFQIIFSDTGIGINKDDLNNIFDRFYRAKKINVDGTGLGLSIAKKIVDLHNGKIEVTSEIEKGTSFIITFPRINF
ncbi:MAG: HAMP domain-containing sensor histidine kinase [Candidatus Sericytochromatia bacterium]